jgi:hypothetical protein
MPKPAILRYIAVIACITIFSGCASYRSTEPFPIEPKQVAVEVVTELPSMWTEMPVGVYAVPNTHFLVSGHQAGAGASMMFGALGVLIGSAINAERGRSLLGDDSALSMHDLVSQTETFLKEGIAANPAGRLAYGAASSGASRLTVLPFAVLSFIDDTDVRPYVVLRTTLTDGAGKETWSTRYISASGEARPLAGDNGWFVANATPLRQAVDLALKRGVDVMMRDIAGNNVRAATKWAYVGGQYAFLKDPLKLKGGIVLDEPGYIAFTPRIGDVTVIAGVNIFDRDIVSIAEATEQDANFAKYEPVARSLQVARTPASATPPAVRESAAPSAVTSKAPATSATPPIASIAPAMATPAAPATLPVQPFKAAPAPAPAAARSAAAPVTSMDDLRGLLPTH